MRVEGSTMPAMEFLALEKEMKNYQQECGMSSVIPKNGLTDYLSKLTVYLEDDRYKSLQGHELEKEQYLRTMRGKTDTNE